MNLIASFQWIAMWMHVRLPGPQRLVEGAATLVLLMAFASVGLPLWFLVAFRPDLDHPVNRLLEACQEGARRGSLAIVGLTAGIIVMVWGTIVLMRFTGRAVRDLRTMRRFGRHLGGRREVSFVAGGVKTAVLVVPDGLAFTAGLLRPRVYLGADLLASLQPREIEAVLLHERHHRTRYDPLRCWLVDLALSSPVFLRGRSLAVYYRAAREAEADRAAVESQGDDRPLLTALTKADGLQVVAGACGLSAERRSALREVRHIEARIRTPDTVTLLVGLSTVLGLTVLAVAGLTDWQWYWFCPTGGSMRQ
ncbi:MAG: hypothetical protein ABIP13_08400 [Tepidiformaceae bacterium]